MIGVVLVAAMAVLAVALASAEKPGTITLHRTLAGTVRFPGPKPKLDWPTTGQAAVEVEGIGTLGRSGDSSPVPIASVAKIMTAYLVLLEHPLAGGQDGFSITITTAEVEEEERREEQGQSVLRVRAGERLNERQALEALLLPSANNVAALLASQAAGGTNGFLARMNATARRLGMDSTTYTSPSGYDPNTVSTASDQLKLARAAMRIPTFAQIVSLPGVELPLVGMTANYNGLVGEDGYVGIKTGSDRAAGGCLVFAKRLRIGSHRLLILGAVLSQREGSLIEAALTSAKLLGDSVARAVHLGDLLTAGAPVMTATGADGEHVRVVARDPLRELGWGGVRVPVAVYPAPATTELHTGQKVATIRDSGVLGASTAAVASNPLNAPSLGWRLLHLP